MRVPPDLARVLAADLGKNYDPQRALEFLGTLKVDNKKLPEAGRLNALLEDPPDEDTSLQTIYETPFVKGEIVVAGKKTREQYPLTKYYPLHFRKTYLQQFSRWETAPAHEENTSRMVWRHFEEEGKHNKVPLPLGSSPTTFRSQLLEGKTVAALSPVHSSHDPKELAAQILKARKNFGGVTGFWKGLESVFETAATLAEGGMLHHDLHEQNMLISPEGEGFIIDFETTEEDDRFGTLAWEGATKEDTRALTECAALTRLCAGPKDRLPEKTELASRAKMALASWPKLLATQKVLKDLLAQEKAGPVMG
jgi:hypothetical protein